MARKIFRGVNGKPEFKHKRMAIKEKMTEGTGSKLLRNVTQEIQEQEVNHWLKMQFWKILPFVLLVLFAVLTIFMMGR